MSALTGRWRCPVHKVSLRVATGQIDLLEDDAGEPKGVCRRLRCPVPGCSAGSRALPPIEPTDRQRANWKWLRTRPGVSVVRPGITMPLIAPRPRSRHSVGARAVLEFARRFPDATAEEQNRFLDLVAERVQATKTKTKTTN